jgi:hypothetical protein
MQSRHPDEVLHPSILAELAGFRSDAGLVFSLYLDLRSDESLPGRFDRLYEQAAQQKKLDQEEPGIRAHWQAEARRVHGWLEREAPHAGAGLAVFSSQAVGLWRVIRLPAPVEDQLVARDQPHVRPLEVMLGEFRRQLPAHEEQRLENERVAELLAHAGDTTSPGGVVGLEQTLLAVRGKKVRLLVVEEDFHLAGGACPNCGFLGEGEEGVCLVCEMALRPEPDIIEAAMQRVLDQAGEIEVLRSPQNRRALEEHGRIGALLGEADEDLPAKVTATALPVGDDGKIHPQVKRDEAVDESFPASDPPGH